MTDIDETRPSGDKHSSNPIFGVQTLSVYFNEEITLVDQSKVTVTLDPDGEGGEPSRVIDLDEEASVAVGEDGKSLVITFVNDGGYPIGNVTVTLAAGAVQDLVGNPNDERVDTWSTLLQETHVTLKENELANNTVEAYTPQLELTVDEGSVSETLSINGNLDDTQLTLLGGVDNTTITLALDALVTHVDASELKGSLVAGLDVSVIGGSLSGTLQADILSSHGGGNQLYGNTGNDTFVLDFSAADAPASTDRIDDFTKGEDKLDVSKLLGDITLATDGRWLAASAGAMVAMPSFYTKANDDDSATVLYYDADGSGDGVAQAVVSFLNDPELKSTDFIIKQLPAVPLV